MKIPLIVAAATTFLAFGCTHLPAGEAAQDKAPQAAEKAPDRLVSPNKRYELSLVQPTERDKYPLIILRDLQTGRKLWDFDYDQIAERQSGELHAGWSPGSKHLAITIQAARVVGTTVLRIDGQNVEEVDFLPIPAKLNKESYTTRGGEYFSHWETNTSLWLNDSTKSRSFRYSLTNKGKLLADAFKDDTLPQ
jgi:hypothetical protein